MIVYEEEKVEASQAAVTESTSSLEMVVSIQQGKSKRSCLRTGLILPSRKGLLPDAKAGNWGRPDNDLIFQNHRRFLFIQ